MIVVEYFIDTNIKKYFGCKFNSFKITNYEKYYDIEFSILDKKYKIPGFYGDRIYKDKLNIWNRKRKLEKLKNLEKSQQ